MPSGGSPAQVVGDFEILSKLGQGGMGAVYRARQISLDRQVALKILPANLEADAEFVSRFQREARVAASFSHANLVKVYSSGQADGCHYIAMELVEGETLGQWLKRGPLPPPAALRIIAAAAGALEYGWQRSQLIHRDIKPGNIFLSQHGDVKVGDLGLAKTMTGDTTGLTQTGTAMGTPHYISPEQARGESNLDFRADIYSLGCTLYQMLTGRTPYTGGDPMAVMSMHRDAPPPAILKVLPQCPIPLARLVGRMLKKAKRERHASYGELLAQIEGVQALFIPGGSPLQSTLPSDPDGTLLPTPGSLATPATPRSATPVTAPVAPPAPPAKSKMPLYAGLGAGAVILGILSVVLWPKEAKLTQAELYARRKAAELHERGLPAPAPTPSTAPASPAADGGGGPWVDWLAKAREGGAIANVAEVSDNGTEITFRGNREFLMADKLRDGALRFTGIRPSYLFFRAVGSRRYLLSIREDSFRLQWREGSGTATTYHNVASWPWPPGFDPAREIVLEVRFQGDRITALCDGALVGTVQDATLTAGVGVGFNGAPGRTVLRKFEYRELPAPSSAAAPAEASWQPLFTDAEWNQSIPGKWRVANGQGHLAKGGRTKPQTFTDGAIRARIRMTADTTRPGVAARETEAGRYKLMVVSPQQIKLGFIPDGGSGWEHLGDGELPQPLKTGDTFVLELRIEGDRLTGLVDGRVIIRVRDQRPKAAGKWGIFADDGWYESVEVQALGAP